MLSSKKQNLATGYRLGNSCCKNYINFKLMTIFIRYTDDLSDFCFHQILQLFIILLFRLGSWGCYWRENKAFPLKVALFLCLELFNSLINHEARISLQIPKIKFG